MRVLLVPVVLCLAATGCPRPPPPPPADAGVAGPLTPWQPGLVLATPRAPNARGFLDRRGLIHAHSIYSHDACDGAPVDDAGVRDDVCLQDFRRGLCQSRHDFVFLTDHRDAFTDTEFPEALLYRTQHGDQLITRDGAPVANRAFCDNGNHAIIMAGCEGSLMPVGLTRHAAATPQERGRLYSSTEAQDMLLLKTAGAVVLAQHTEDWTVEQLSTLPFDGFEMFNVHANMVKNAGTALELLVALNDRPESLPHPDLALLPIVTEDPVYLSAWGSVLAGGARRVTTMGTDCHRNTFRQPMADGERVDSYRRMMISFSNHLLVTPQADGLVTDVELRQALAAGRLFGVFEYLGFPTGFDFRAEAGGAVHEMGAAVGLGAQLRLTMPAVLDLDPAAEQPVLTARILRARERGWDVVAEGAGDVDFTPTLPGAYRGEIRIKAHHLRPHAGYDADYLVNRDLPWVYSNAIYLTGGG